VGDVLQYPCKHRHHHLERVQGLFPHPLRAPWHNEIEKEGINEYLNSFIQLSRYAPDDVSTDEKKQDMFLNGLNDGIQFQLLNTDYADFQHMVDKAIIVENKIREMEKDGKRKVPFSGQSSGSNVRPRFS
jgi:hypothetical protein